MSRSFGFSENLVTSIRIPPSLKCQLILPYESIIVSIAVIYTNTSTSEFIENIVTPVTARLGAKVSVLLTPSTKLKAARVRTKRNNDIFARTTTTCNHLM